MNVIMIIVIPIITLRAQRGNVMDIMTMNMRRYFRMLTSGAHQRMIMLTTQKTK